MAKILNTSDFREKVENGNGVAVVDFFATWCGPCKMLAPVFEEASNDMDEAVFYKVDIDESLEIAQEYGITTVPTMVVFKDGKIADKIVGFMPKDAIVDRVRKSL